MSTQEIFSLAAQLILALSILVVLHEFGHYITAKWFKMRIDKFYLFFDAGFSLFKKKIGDTEWGIGWLPLGGYVKIAGMVDESMDTKKLSSVPEPHEFRAKPAWQRLIVMLGGIIVNLLLGFMIFILLLWMKGESYIQPANAKFGMGFSETLLKAGFKNKDILVSVNGKKLEKTTDLLHDILFSEAQNTNVTVLRNGAKTTFSIPDSIITLIQKNKEDLVYTPLIPLVIDSINDNGVAKKYDLQKNDRIVGINHINISSITEFHELKDSFKNKEVNIKFSRNNIIDSLNVIFDSTATLGVFNKPVDSFITVSKREYSLLEAIPAGISKSINVITSQFQAFFGKKNKIKIKENVGGLLSIAKMFNSGWDWTQFWFMTGILSLVLAFMNLLPIPALDGGHVVFLLIEIITGKAPSQKVLEVAQMIGMVLLLGLMLLINGTEIFSAIKGLFN